MNREAVFYRTTDSADVICELCPHHCRIPADGRGRCRQRENRDRQLLAAGYAACASIAVDPIEKKPLYHFYPGSLILSLGGRGCNLSCAYCQNWQIAHADGPVWLLTAREAVELCQHWQRQHQSELLGIAFTYSEPGVWFEYVLDTARLARDFGFRTVMVTNGYLNRAPFVELCEVIDAFNIDLKAFTAEFYRDVVGGRLEVVKGNIAAAVERGNHVEISYLVVPGLNDSAAEIESMASWLAQLDRDLPLHLNRYYPAYKMRLEATPLAALQQSYAAASNYLNFVYIGNALLTVGRNTFCPTCGSTVIERSWPYSVRLVGLSEQATCSNCGRHLPIKTNH